MVLTFNTTFQINYNFHSTTRTGLEIEECANAKDGTT